MKIQVKPEKAGQASQELLTLSRSLRQARERLEDVRRQLRWHSQLEECRYAIQRQEEALALSTAKIVDMSRSLQEITQLYWAAENKNTGILEERGSVARSRGEVVTFGQESDVNRRIRRILNQS